MQLCKQSQWVYQVWAENLHPKGFFLLPDGWLDKHFIVFRIEHQRSSQSRIQCVECNCIFLFNGSSQGSLSYHLWHRLIPAIFEPECNKQYQYSSYVSHFHRRHLLICSNDVCTKNSIKFGTNIIERKKSLFYSEIFLAPN